MSATLSGRHPRVGSGRARAAGSGGLRRVVGRLAPLAIYAALAVGVVLHAEQVVSWLENTERALGSWGAIVYALLGGLFVAAAGPASLVNLGAGAVFGFWKGLGVAFGAAMVGSTVAYAIARRGGGRFAKRFSERHDWFRVLRERIGGDAKLATFLRLSPVVPLAVSSYALGLARMRVRVFLQTAPAVLPPLALYVGAAAFARGVWHSGSRPWWEWAVLVVGGLATLGVMVSVTRAIRAAVVETQEASRSSEEEEPVSMKGRERGEAMEAVRRPLSREVSLPIAERDGAERRVGVEVELHGVSVAECAAAVAARFGGEVSLAHEHEGTVDTPLGQFKVELDSRPLKSMAAELHDSPEAGSTVDEVMNRVLLGLAQPFVPVEIVTPPLSVARFAELDGLVSDLRERGARGTGDRIFYAFGVHFNPEVPSLRPESIVAHLQAFFLLRDWIRKEGQTDLARRVTPHIEPHPDALVERVLQTAYAPTLEQLIDDYLELSPTRNRDLDMLPLFAFLDEERVRAVLPDEKINPRPTYHYRLPNSQVGDPEWRISDEWRSWVLVERLAHDRERLRGWIRAWHIHRGEVLVELFQPWVDEVEDRIVE